MYVWISVFTFASMHSCVIAGMCAGIFFCVCIVCTYVCMRMCFYVLQMALGVEDSSNIKMSAIRPPIIHFTNFNQNIFTKISKNVDRLDASVWCAYEEIRTIMQYIAVYIHLRTHRHVDIWYVWAATVLFKMHCKIENFYSLPNFNSCAKRKNLVFRNSKL